MSKEERHEWDRLSGESSKAYAHFCLYRDMGQDRSLRKLATDAKCTSQLRQLQRWSSAWNWVERSGRYDCYLEYQDRLRQQKERAAMGERQAKIGVLAQNIAVRRMEALLSEVERGVAEMTPSDLARLLDIGVKTERLARGEAGNVRENRRLGGAPHPVDNWLFVYAVRAALGFRDREWAEIESGNSRRFLPPDNFQVP